MRRNFNWGPKTEVFRAKTGGHDRNPDGSIRNPTDPARMPRNRAVLPGSNVYTHKAKKDWDNRNFEE